MAPIEYIVRDAAGSARSGFSFDDNPSSITVAGSKDISLNVSAADVASYQQIGSDLVIVLRDGQTIMLDGYYDTAATGAKNLFLSEDGQLVAVTLDEGQNGIAQASYEAMAVGEKWSAYDELVFLDLDRVEPVVAPLAAPLISPLAARTWRRRGRGRGRSRGCGRRRERR